MSKGTKRKAEDRRQTRASQFSIFGQQKQNHGEKAGFNAWSMQQVETTHVSSFNHLTWRGLVSSLANTDSMRHCQCQAADDKTQLQ